VSDPDKTLQMTVPGAPIPGPEPRREVSVDELLRVLTTHMRMHEQCPGVRVIGVTRLDALDTDGCNWSSSVVLDPAGVAPEIYSVVYADVVKHARERYNLA
jgi:hypothetical protein